MAQRGICSTCRKFRWLSRSGQCKPCGYPMGKCAECNRLGKIYVRGLCYLCYQHEQVVPKLKEIEVEFKPLTKYNGNLFALYLTYLRRYRLQYFHLGQSKDLSYLFQTESILPLTSWAQVYEYHEKFPLPNSKSKANGSAFIKVAYMLVELGVLPPREEDLSIQIKNLLKVFKDEELNRIKRFINDLRKTRCSEGSLRNYLVALKSLKEWQGEDLMLSADRRQIELYLDFQFGQGLTLSGVRSRWICLNKFFKWSLLSRLILVNPCENIQAHRPAPQLTVCSEEQIQKLLAFIKNPQSDPESAFLLSLLLFFGLKSEDLTHAKLTLQKDQLALNLRRKTLTKGRMYYNREESLRLPSKPPWFFHLQKRFYEKWLLHYQKVKKTYPNHPLLLPYSNHFNHSISGDVTQDRIQKASFSATGVAIPARVLRQTCGHIYSRKQDASMLARMGWSSQFAFHYTWLPRKYFTKK